MEQHQQLLEDILTKGRKKLDRTGVGTYSLFGAQMEFDLSEGFPVTTARKIFTRGTFAETLWFLSGSTNNEVLREANVHFWTRWALTEDKYKERMLEPHERVLAYAKMLGTDPKQIIQELNKMGSVDAGHVYLDAQGVPRVQDMKIASKGDLGPVYGRMWRNWPTSNGQTIDQVATLVENLKKIPWSRRHIVSGWNPELLPDETKSHEENILNGKQCLPPCHTLFQFIVEPLTLEERMDYAHLTVEGVQTKLALTTSLDNLQDAMTQYLDNLMVPDKMLSCKLHARSQDVPVGTVFNIISYSLLVHMLCQQLNMKPGRYIHSMGDAHIYTNQIECVKKQLEVELRPLPTLNILRKPESIFDYNVEDFELVGYDPNPKIDYPIAV